MNIDNNPFFEELEKRKQEEDLYVRKAFEDILINKLTKNIKEKKGNDIETSYARLINIIFFAYICLYFIPLLIT